MNRRLPAEWEPQSAVQLSFPHAGTDWADILQDVLPCFVQISESISRFEKVIVVCQDTAYTKSLFSAAALKQIIFVEAATNDTWARDHGGITVEIKSDGKQNFVLLDFVFNGWGLKFPADKDNLLTGILFRKGLFNAGYRHAGLVLEGGGIESDGKGTLMTTAECLLSLNRNPHLSKQEIEHALKSLFGVTRILWLHHGYLAGDDTDSHIDTLARFCNEHTIAYVKCDDPEDEHFEALSFMEKELQDFRQSDGTPYILVPLPWPEACFDEDGYRLPATYANFLIVNHAVLVPTYQVPQDEAALAVFRSIFPDHTIVGIDCRPLILQHGSLHCVTMQYPLGSLSSNL